MPLKSLMIFLVLLASSSNALSFTTKNAQFQAESNSLKIFKSTLFLQEESTETTTSSSDTAEKALTETTTEATDTEGDKIEDGEEEEEEESLITSASTLEVTAPVSAFFLQEEDTVAIASDDDEAAEKTDEDEDILDSVDTIVEGFNDEPNGDEQYTQNFLQVQNGLDTVIELLQEADNTGSDDTSVKVEDEVEEEQDDENVDGLETEDDKPEKTT